MNKKHQKPKFTFTKKIQNNGISYNSTMLLSTSAEISRLNKKTSLKGYKNKDYKALIKSSSYLSKVSEILKCDTGDVEKQILIEQE